MVVVVLVLVLVLFVYQVCEFIVCNKNTKWLVVLMLVLVSEMDSLMSKSGRSVPWVRVDRTQPLNLLLDAIDLLAIRLMNR